LVIAYDSIANFTQCLQQDGVLLPFNDPAAASTHGGGVVVMAV